MKKKSLHTELLAVDDQKRPRGLPNCLYRQGSLQEEYTRIFSQNWCALAYVHDLEPGAGALPVQFVDKPLVIVRDLASKIRVFHNVCRHRGQILVHEKSNELKGCLRCPYHSWSYGLDGSLIGTPHINGIGQHHTERFDKSDFGLFEVRSHIWMGIVFINIGEQAQSFENWIAPVEQRWERFCPDLSCFQVDADSRFELLANSNWKLAVENYCESYHLPWVHPDLNRYSRLEDHYNINESMSFGFSGQGSTCYRFFSPDQKEFLPLVKDWPCDLHNTAEYLALYPNLLIGLQADHFYAIILSPLTHNQTREDVQLYFLPQVINNRDRYESLIGALSSFWYQVFNEDLWAVSGMQKGRESPSFDGGLLASPLDEPTLGFCRWVSREIVAAES